MTYVDLAVLNFTEWCCRKFQLLTGKTNVWLAVQLTNLSIIIYFVAAAMYSLRIALAARIAVATFCGGLLYVLTQTIFKVSIETYEGDAYRRVAKGLRNPRRVRDALLRISFLTLSLVLPPLLTPALLLPPLLVSIRPFFPVIVLGYSLIVMTTVLLYVLACDPLPPCPGKVTEWARGFAPARVASPESSRQ